VDELKEHLRPLEEDGHISLWEDMESSAQTTREHAVIPCVGYMRHPFAKGMGLLLISSIFFGAVALSMKG
jgi:hypothetical protein